MTSVEDAVSITQGLRPVEPPRAKVRGGKATPKVAPVHAAASPRISATLERRKTWERNFRWRLRLTDSAIALTATGLSALIQVTLVDVPATVVIRNSSVLLIAWLLMLSGMGSRSATILGAGATEYRRVVNASAVGFGVLAITGVLFDWEGLRTPLLLALPLGVLALLVGRWTWRRWLIRQRLAGRYASRTLVVGNRSDVEYVVNSLQKGGENGYHVIGATLLDGSTTGLTLGETTYPVVGSVNSVATVAARLGADTIMVASRPENAPDFVQHLSWQLEGTASELVLSSRLTDVAGPRISLRQVDGLPLIQVKIPTYEGGRHLLKRALDIVVSAVALIPIALITPLLAVLIKLDSPGPVFFYQERVGRDGHTFKMVKFRSMKTDAEQALAALKAQNEGSGPLFKMKDDPRITRVGRILRKFSLDELPQFWNVLTGGMSVVGPRPPLPSEVTAYDGTVFRRLYIKPGITGLWQVSGRSDLSWDESVRLDLRYVENWSVMNDLQIMWRTAKVMIRPTGAY